MKSTISSGNTEATTCTWESFNRLTGVTLPSSDAYQYRLIIVPAGSPPGRQAAITPPLSSQED